MAVFFFAGAASLAVEPADLDRVEVRLVALDVAFAVAPPAARLVAADFAVLPADDADFEADDVPSIFARPFFCPASLDVVFFATSACAWTEKRT